MRPYYVAPDLTLYCGSALDVLRELPSESVQTCITSPPFYGLRDYGTGIWAGGAGDCTHVKILDATQAVASSTLAGGKRTTGHQQEGYRGACRRCGAVRIDQQIGLEETLAGYLDRLVAVFVEVMRVLRPDGLLFLECGDSYAGAGYSNHTGTGGAQRADGGKQRHTAAVRANPGKSAAAAPCGSRDGLMAVTGFRRKQLMLVPHRLAIALGDAGWLLRQTNVWHRPNPMPESVTDRTTTAHSYVFQFARQERYFYDCDAVREATGNELSEAEYAARTAPGATWASGGIQQYAGAHKHDGGRAHPRGRNRRSVWSIPTQPFSGSHFAVFPEALITPLVLCSTRPGDVVLEPFAGSGTTLAVARSLGRRAVGIELSQKYCRLAQKRIEAQTPALWLDLEVPA